MIVFNRETRFYLIIWSLFFVILIAFFKVFYRPIIYSNHIFDCHLADSYSNLFCVPASACLFYAIEGKAESSMLFDGICSCVAFALYEFFLSYTFGYYDIIASVISSCVTFYVFDRLLVKR